MAMESPTPSSCASPPLVVPPPLPLPVPIIYSRAHCASPPAAPLCHALKLDGASPPADPLSHGLKRDGGLPHHEMNDNMSPSAAAQTTSKQFSASSCGGDGGEEAALQENLRASPNGCKYYLLPDGKLPETNYIHEGVTLPPQRTYSNDHSFELQHAPDDVLESAKLAPNHMGSTYKCGDSPFSHHITQIFGTNLPTEKDEKLKVLAVEGGVPKAGTSTFMQATFNCVSLLYGLGILSSPYAVAQAGWMGVIISLMIATTYAYTAYLMTRCMKYRPECSTYQEIAKLALGRRARLVITTFFYMELTGTLLGYSISVGDNLSHIFPDLRFRLPGLSNRNFMIFLASLFLLPTVWLRDLSAISFTSMWCIVSSILLLIAVMLAATVNRIGFMHSIPFIRFNGVPIAAGLYAFSYGGTSVFPSIYTSMKDPTKFTQVVVLSFAIATVSIVGLGVAGATMFGDQTASQITLSMPTQLVTTKIVLWMTVLTPMFKFALLLSPITTALEIQLHRRCKWSPSVQWAMGMLMRSTVLALIAIAAMILPYFNYIVALIGSSMTVLICMVFPCIFYVKLCWRTLRIRTIVMIIALVSIGIIAGMCGTVVSFKGLIYSKKDHTS